MEAATHVAAVKYASVNGKWSEGTSEGRSIKPTPQEAMAGAKRLYRVAMGKPWRGPMKLTSGRRHTRIAWGTFYVNPDHTWDSGWHGIVHSISHHASWQRYRENHGPRHAFIERELIDYTVRSGYFKRERKEKVAEPRVSVRKRRVSERIATWEAKRKRADTALKKLYRSQRYYDRMAA